MKKKLIIEVVDLDSIIRDAIERTASPTVRSFLKTLLHEGEYGCSVDQSFADSSDCSSCKASASLDRSSSPQPSDPDRDRTSHPPERR